MRAWSRRPSFQLCQRLPGAVTTGYHHNHTPNKPTMYASPSTSSSGTLANKLALASAAGVGENKSPHNSARYSPIASPPNGTTSEGSVSITSVPSTRFTTKVQPIALSSCPSMYERTSGPSAPLGENAESTVSSNARCAAGFSAAYTPARTSTPKYAKLSTSSARQCSENGATIHESASIRSRGGTVAAADGRAATRSTAVLLLPKCGRYTLPRTSRRVTRTFQ